MPERRAACNSLSCPALPFVRAAGTLSQATTCPSCGQIFRSHIPWRLPEQAQRRRVEPIVAGHAPLAIVEDRPASDPAVCSLPHFPQRSERRQSHRRPGLALHASQALRPPLDDALHPGPVPVTAMKKRSGISAPACLSSQRLVDKSLEQLPHHPAVSGETVRLRPRPQCLPTLFRCLSNEHNGWYKHRGRSRSQLD